MEHEHASWKLLPCILTHIMFTSEIIYHMLKLIDWGDKKGKLDSLLTSK